MLDVDTILVLSIHPCMTAYEKAFYPYIRKDPVYGTRTLLESGAIRYASYYCKLRKLNSFSLYLPV